MTSFFFFALIICPYQMNDSDGPFPDIAIDGRGLRKWKSDEQDALARKSITHFFISGLFRRWHWCECWQRVCPVVSLPGNIPILKWLEQFTSALVY